MPFGIFKVDKTFQTNTYETKDTEIHSTIEREDDIADEVSNLIESASLFYDQQIEGYE